MHLLSNRTGYWLVTGVTQWPKLDSTQLSQFIDGTILAPNLMKRRNERF